MPLRADEHPHPRRSGQPVLADVPADPAEELVPCRRHAGEVGHRRPGGVADAAARWAVPAGRAASCWRRPRPPSTPSSRPACPRSGPTRWSASQRPARPGGCRPSRTRRTGRRGSPSTRVRRPRPTGRRPHRDRWARPAARCPASRPPRRRTPVPARHGRPARPASSRRARGHARAPLPSHPRAVTDVECSSSSLQSTVPSRAWYSATSPGQFVVILGPSTYQLEQPDQAESPSLSCISRS